jgi:hypothetical protein
MKVVKMKKTFTCRTSSPKRRRRVSRRRITRPAKEEGGVIEDRGRDEWRVEQ